MSWHGWLWTALGGTVNDAGEPTLGPDDRVAVFEGSPDQAQVAHRALVSEELDPELQMFVESRSRMSIERGRVSVPVAQASAADDVLVELDWLDNLLHPEGQRELERLPDDADSMRYDRERPGRPAPIEFGWLGMRCVQFILLVWALAFGIVLIRGLVELRPGGIVLGLIATLAGGWALRASERRIRRLRVAGSTT